MKIDEAEELVLEWLDNGGTPTDKVHYVYKYENPKVTYVYGCAGAVLAELTGEEDCLTLGRKYYKDDYVFYGLSSKFGGTTPEYAAQNLRYLIEKRKGNTMKSPIKTVTKKEVVPGVYGQLQVAAGGSIHVGWTTGTDNIRDIIKTLTEIVEIWENRED